VVIVAPSDRPEADVEYTVGYVGIDKAHIDYQGNCGNLSMAVGPFAVDEGMVPAIEPLTRVHLFNTNTNKIIEAEVPVVGGKAVSQGDFAIDGVPRPGARIVLNFTDAAGSKTGKLLPTGNVVDRIVLSGGRTVRCSLVDAAAPSVFVQAAEIGFEGTESPADAAADPGILRMMEEIRIQAAILMGLAADPASVSPAMPKIAFVSAPKPYRTIAGKNIEASECDLLARTKALTVMHKAYAITGGIALSAAASIEGTVVHDVVAAARDRGTIRVGHPSGVSTFIAEIVRKPSGGFELTKSAVAGNARRIMDGYVYVPETE
jgi:2-methylaconitate cis-trans-isomerase PrpF